MSNIGLKQDIVVKSKFTIRAVPGHGSLPSVFVAKYISRTGATEPLLPAGQDQLQLENYITRYISRATATEQARQERGNAQILNSKLQTESIADGRVFGDKGLAYTADQVEDAADDVQMLWYSGHAVQLMVVSFTTDYMKRKGIIPKSLLVNQPGDLRGQVDELKLRTAISRSVQQMAKEGHYQEPLWTAAIHVNKLQVHAHIVLTDQIAIKDSERLISQGWFKGQERGVLTQKLCNRLRLSVHHQLNNLSQLVPYHDQVDLERHNVITNVDSLVTQQVSNNAKLQQLIASLPSDKRQWRYGSNSKIMKRPNELMDYYLSDAITNYHDALGVGKVLDAIRKYSVIKQQSDELPPESRQKFYQQGRQLLITRMANQVYRSLKTNVNSESLTVTSPFLRQQAQDTDEVRNKIKLANISYNDNKTKNPELDLTMFTYRLGSYRQRLGHHLEQADQLQESIKRFDRASRSGEVSPDALVLRSFYSQERHYHMQVVDKYRYFLQLRDSSNQASQERYAARQNDLRQRYEQLTEKARELGITSKNANNSVDDPQLRKNELIDQLLIDPRLSHVLKLTDANQISVETYLEQSRAKQIFLLPSYAHDVLNAVGNRMPEYKQVGSTIQTLSKRHEPRESNNITKLYWDYVNELGDVTYEAFTDGLLRENQVVNAPQYREDVSGLIANGIPTVPEILNQKDRLNPRYFDQIKGLDLHDLTYDINPGTTRKVSPMAKRSYHRANEIRLAKVDAANQYLKSTDQPIAGFQQLEEQLNEQVKFGDKVERTGELGFDNGFGKQGVNPFDRNMATLPEISADIISQKYVVSTYTDNQEISERISENSELDLFHLIGPEDPLTDTNRTGYDDTKNDEFEVG